MTKSLQRRIVLFRAPSPRWRRSGPMCASGIGSTSLLHSADP